MVDGQEEFEVDEVLTHKPQGKKKTDPKVKAADFKLSELSHDPSLD